MNKQYLICVLLGSLLMPLGAYAQTCTNTAIPESTPTSGFTFSSDGTVTDNTTGLMWKRCLEGRNFADNGTPSNYLDDQCIGTASTMNWQAALNQAQTLNTTGGFATYSDWRIPNTQELLSIVEYCRVNPAINTDVFPGSFSSEVWSSSSVAGDNASYTWLVHFFEGSSYWNSRGNGYHVRLVRSSQ